MIYRSYYKGVTILVAPFFISFNKFFELINHSKRKF